MRGLLLNSVFLFFCFGVSGQELPADSIFYNSLSNYYQSLLEADLKELDIKKKRSWTKYLPSLGLTYTVSGSPRPSLRYDPLSILAVNENKELQELKRSSIIIRYESLIYEQFIILENLIYDYNIDLEEIRNSKDLVEIDSQLMAMTEEKYKREMIKPSQYLQEKKRYLEMKLTSERQMNDLKKKETKIYNSAKLSRTNLLKFLSPLN